MALRWRLDAAYLIDGDKRSLHLLHAAENVFEIEVGPLAAIVEGLLFDGHVATQLGEALAGQQVVGLEGGFDVAVVGDGLVWPVLFDDLREGLRNQIWLDLVARHEAHRGAQIWNLLQFRKLVKHQQQMVPVRVGLFHESIEDQLEH